MVRKRVAWVNIEIGVPYPSTPPHYPSLVNHSLCACVFVSFTNILQATRVPTALFSSALQCLQHHEQHPQHYSVRNTTNKQLQWPAWRQPVIYKSWSLLQTTTVNQTIAIHITGQQTNQPNKQQTTAIFHPDTDSSPKWITWKCDTSACEPLKNTALIYEEYGGDIETWNSNTSAKLCSECHASARMDLHLKLSTSRFTSKPGVMEPGLTDPTTGQSQFNLAPRLPPPPNPNFSASVTAPVISVSAL